MRVKIFVVCLFLLLAWKVPSVAANETYTYVGNPFNLCSGTLAFPGRSACLSQYTITGSFTTTLDPFHLQNLTDFTIPSSDIASFSFLLNGSDLAVDQSNATASLFNITTDSSGHITSPQGWEVFVRGATAEMFTSSCLMGSCRGAQDWLQGFDPQGSPTADYGQSAFEVPGRWSDSVSVSTDPPAHVSWPDGCTNSLSYRP